MQAPLFALLHALALELPKIQGHWSTFTKREQVSDSRTQCLLEAFGCKDLSDGRPAYIQSQFMPTQILEQ